MDEPGVKYLLSHASPHSDFVRDVGVRMQPIGADVFFDDWSIDYGESIPCAIDSALEIFEVVVLFWSKEASESSWTAREYRSALHTYLDDTARRVILVRMDDTEPPRLLRDLKWIAARNLDVAPVVSGIMRIKHDAERMKALQGCWRGWGDRVQRRIWGCSRVPALRRAC